MPFNTRHFFAEFMLLILPLSIVTTNIDKVIIIEKVTKNSDASINNT